MMFEMKSFSALVFVHCAIGESIPAQRLNVVQLPKNSPRS